MNTSRFLRLIKPMSSYLRIGIFKRYHDVPFAKRLDEPSPVNTEAVHDQYDSRVYGEILEPGMILFKDYLTAMEKVGILNMCDKMGTGVGGLYMPIYDNRANRLLPMMCFGRNWDPVTRYKNHYRSESPPLPYELISLAESAIQDSQIHHDEHPLMRPDVCLIHFYPIDGRLGLHQDCDESYDSVRRGLPVIYITIGASAEFVYGHTRDEESLSSIILDEGDVLIFGGKSRLIYHGVNQILTSPACGPLHISLTSKQF